MIIMDDAEGDLIRALKRAEKELYDQIMRVFDNTTITDGKLSSSPKAEEFLASLDRRILLALKASGYNDAVKNFMYNFDEIADNVTRLQSKLNNVNITPSQINPVKRIEVQNTLDGLIGNKFSASTVQPLRQGLYRNILFGSSVADTEKYLRNYIVSAPGTDSKFVKYVQQLSRDSISQFDGALQTGIRGELDMNAMRYVGSLLKDSRAQCCKWTEMGLIKLNFEFEKEIEAAIDRRLFFGKKVASGMIPETTILNILIYRGGYNCRHRAIPTKFFEK